MDRFFLHPLSDLPRAFTFHISDSALVPGAAFPWPWLVVRRAGSPRGNMCSLLRGAGAGTGTVTGCREGRNKVGIEALHKAFPAASRSQSLAGSHRARRRGKGAGPRWPRAGRRERGRSSASSRCGARRVPSRAGLAGAARALRRAVRAGRRLRTAQTPRSQAGTCGPAAPRVSRPAASQALPRHAAPRRVRARGWGGPGAAGASGRNLPGLPAPVPPPALSSSTPPGNVCRASVWSRD